MSAMFQGRRALLVRMLAGVSVLAAAPARAAGLSGSDYLTASARMLAGLDPDVKDRRFQRLAEQKAWRDQIKACRAGADKLRHRLDTIDSWRREYLGAGPSGGTLVYPFSGPDFVNAYAMFPDRDNYVFFSLEEPGVPPALDKMDGERLGRTLIDLRAALNDLVHLNFFITPNMEQQLNAGSLRGVAPVLMAQMALLDLRIERFSRIDLWPDRSAEIARLPVASRPKLPMQAIQVDFSHPSAPGRPQTLWYFSLDVSDAQLKHYPEFVAWLRDFRDPIVLLKSASYLLHGDGFKQVRSFILERASEIVQDDTGIPYRMLASDPWRVSLHGQYEQPVELFKKRYQDDLAAAFQKTGGGSVPFPFGYNWRTRGNSFVIVARRERTSI